MVIPFIKMEGCGNDYIYMDCMKTPLQEPQRLAIAMSHRHFGVGGDGIVLLCPGDKAPVKMRMFNADGSEGNMCGNAIRCVAKLMGDLGYSRESVLTVETKSGLRHLTVEKREGDSAVVTVNMGSPMLTPSDIPARLVGETVIDRSVQMPSRAYRITCVSMGNPHAVTFVEDVHAADLEKIGLDFQSSGLFPEGINTEIVRFVDETHLEMRVWERGSGETLACGTGACAAVTAAILTGRCKANRDVTVSLLGGDLQIRYTDSGVFMRGACRTVFSGEYVWNHAPKNKLAGE